MRAIGNEPRLCLPAGNARARNHKVASQKFTIYAAHDWYSLCFSYERDYQRGRLYIYPRPSESARSISRRSEIIRRTLHPRVVPFQAESQRLTKRTIDGTARGVS